MIVNADQDGDAILTGHELGGYDPNNDGVSDGILNSYGASPFQKVFSPPLGSFLLLSLLLRSMASLGQYPSYPSLANIASQYTNFDTGVTKGTLRPFSFHSRSDGIRGNFSPSLFFSSLLFCTAFI